MALGSNRDYKTQERRVRKTLARHYERMLELQAQGMTRDAASEQAYQEILQYRRPDPGSKA